MSDKGSSPQHLATDVPHAVVSSGAPPEAALVTLRYSVLFYHHLLLVSQVSETRGGILPRVIHMIGHRATIRMSESPLLGYYHLTNDECTTIYEITMIILGTLYIGGSRLIKTDQSE